MKEFETMKLLIRHEYEKNELGKYNPKTFDTYLLEKLAEIRIVKVQLEQQLILPTIVQAKPEKVCELIRQKFDDWVFGLETQAGEKIKIVDSTDFNDIIRDIKNELYNLKEKQSTSIVGFEKYIRKVHPDPDSVLIDNIQRWNQIVLLAEKYAKQTL